MTLIHHRDYDCYESARACEVGARIDDSQFARYKRAHRINRVPATVEFFPGIGGGFTRYSFDGGNYSFESIDDQWIGCDHTR